MYICYFLFFLVERRSDAGSGSPLSVDSGLEELHEEWWNSKNFGATSVDLYPISPTGELRVELGRAVAGPVVGGSCAVPSQ